MKEFYSFIDKFSSRAPFINPKKLKILIITTSLQMGGIERSSSNLANEFSKQGLEVFFFCIFKHKKFFTLEEKIIFLEPTSKTPQRLNLILAPFRIRKTVKKIAPNSILVFNKFYGAQALFGLMGLNHKVFISERASPAYKFPFFISIFNKIVYKIFKPAGIIAQTSYAASLQKHYYKGNTKITVINNPVRDLNFLDLPQKKLIIAVGRFNDRMKGFDRLIDGFSRIKNNDWTLAFVGGNKENGTSLIKQAEDLGVQNRIIFLGKSDQLNRIYSEAGIFVLPSRSEGFPNALVEAMTAGLPCISFKFSPAITEIIEDGFNGLLIEEGNIVSLAAKLDYLIENESERIRLGNNARAIKKRLSGEVVCRKYLDFILPEWKETL